MKLFVVLNEVKHLLDSLPTARQVRYAQNDKIEINCVVTESLALKAHSFQLTNCNDEVEKDFTYGAMHLGSAAKWRFICTNSRRMDLDAWR